MIKILNIFVLLFVSFSAIAEYRAAMFIPHSSAFWDQLSLFSEAAATDVGMTLDIYLAEDSGEHMLEQVRKASKEGVNAIIFMEYKGVGEDILKISEQYQIPALLFNTSLDNDKLLPRAHYKQWLGSIVPDDRKAGMRLAIQLLAKAEKQFSPPFNILAYTGLADARSHARRVQGLKEIIDAREDVFLLNTISHIANTEDAKPYFAQAFKQNPDVNVIWSISDLMAVSAGAYYRKISENNNVVVGGIDWNPSAIASVQSGKIDLDLGGHFFDGAQAVVMIFDYLNGKDFAEEKLVFDSNMVVINKRNGASLQGLISSPESINYKTLSKVHNAELRQYRFDLGVIAEAVTSKVAFTATEQAFIANHPVIEIGVDGNWPPIDFFDEQGVFSGIAADYHREIEARTGMVFKPVKSDSFKIMLNKVVEGELLIGSTISYNQRRAENLTFTEPFFKVKKVITVSDRNQNIQSMSDLKGKTVAVEDGYITMQKLKASFPEIKLLPVKNSLSALQQVSWGKADAYIGNQSVSAWLMHNNQLTNLHFVGDSELGSGPQNFAISKHAPNGEVLKSIIDKVLATMDAKERYGIEQAWLNTSEPKLRKKVVLNLSAKQKEWLKNHSVLKLGIDPDWAPVEYIDSDGIYKGIASDVISLISERLGVALTVETGLSWPEVHEQVKQKQLDLLPALSRTPNREKYLNFIDPYIEFPQVIFTRDDSTTFLSGLNDLYGRTVAIEKGYVAEERLTRQHPNINLIMVDTTLQALKLVVTGDVDAYVGNLTIGSYLITKYGLSNVKVAAPTPYTNFITMGVRKDWPELVPILQKAIDSIDDSEMATIRQKWMAVRYDLQTDYTLAIQILIAAFVVFALISLWGRQIKQHNKALEKGEERLRLTLESASLGSWELCLSGTEVQKGHWNENFEGHHHITDASGLSSMSSFYQTIAEDYAGKLVKTFNAYLSGQTKHFNAEYLTRAGNWVLVEGQIFDYDSDGKPSRIIGISRDITHEKQMQTMAKKLTHKVMKSNALLDIANYDLRSANEKLQEMDRLKSMFIASISHELRTPLNSIIGFSSMMSRGTFGELSPKYTDYSQRINRSGQHLLALITDIIDISKIESGRVDVRVSEFDLNEVINEAVNSLRSQIESKGIELLVDAPATLVLSTDRRRVFQCILNLLSNAYKYSEQGLISINVQRYKGQVKINVSDTGIGIAKEDQARLFEAFERMDSHLRIKAGGTGLGLYLTKKIITDLLQGDISVTSRLNQGSSFVITLPESLPDKAESDNVEQNNN